MTGIKNELHVHSYLHETGTFSSFIIAAFEMIQTQLHAGRVNNWYL